MVENQPPDGSLNPRALVLSFGGNCKVTGPLFLWPLFERFHQVDALPLSEHYPGQGTHWLPQLSLSILGTPWNVKKYYLILQQNLFPYYFTFGEA